MQPRIYTYKITFEEVSYYYYGVHKEKKFGEYYMGSPVTHKWYWDFYTPKKQILEFFDYTDEGWIKAQEVETRLTKPFYQTDQWCLNESCGAQVSLKVLRKTGKKLYENKVGFHARTKEEMIEHGKKTKELSKGIFSRTKEQMSEDGKKAANKAKELKVGIYSFTKEQRQKICRKSLQKQKELKVGIYGLTFEQRSEISKRNNTQRWQCTITGYVSTSAGLANYQKKRGIDKSNRIRLN